MPHLRAFGALALAYGQMTLARQGDSAERTVRAAYRAMLGREPQADELNTCAAELRSGSMKIGGLLRRLTADAAFQARYAPQPAGDPAVERACAEVQATLPPAADDEQYIAAAYQLLLGRAPDSAGQSAALAGLRAGTLSRRDLVAALVASDEYRQDHPAGPRLSAAQLYAQVIAAAGAEAGEQAFLEAAYQVVFRRPADEAGSAHFRRLFARDAITRPGVIEAMMKSSEYQRAIGRTIKPIDALHQARMLLFQQHLPPARNVLDLGGAAHNHAEGALLLMGYPHRPEQITIVDLPPDDRIGGAAAAEQLREIVTGDGIRVRYLYRSMADLADLPAASFDLIVSGESIEHISEADAELVCREAFRLLAPGGSFCLDTPNAALTRIQSPAEFIHPEHQKEYLMHELRDMLSRNGFVLTVEKAICPLPDSLRSGQFDIEEFARNIRLSDRPEEGYLFYIHAIKPA